MCSRLSEKGRLTLADAKGKLPEAVRVGGGEATQCGEEAASKSHQRSDKAWGDPVDTRPLPHALLITFTQPVCSKGYMFPHRDTCAQVVLIVAI